MATTKTAGRKTAGSDQGGAEAPQVQMIPLKRLRESAQNPRSHWSGLEGLAASIKDAGVLQPIIVRPIPGAQADSRGIEPSLEIVVGHRRARACKLAGLTMIPAIVRDETDCRAMADRITENDQREPLNDLDQARAYQDAIDSGFTVASLAAETGRDESYIYRRLQLLKMIEPARQAFLIGKIHFGHAELIARLQEADQEDLFAKRGPLAQHSEMVPTIPQLRRHIEQNYMLDLNAAAWPKDDLDLVILAGACTTCSKRTGYQPALWPEIAAQDTCTDRACYKQKAFAWAARRQEELREQNKPAVKISETYGGRSLAADVLPQQQWQEITPAEAKTLPSKQVMTGVLVDGQSPGREVLVRVASETRAQKAANVPPAAEEATDQADDEDARKAAQQTAINKAVFLAIARRGHVALRPCDWIVIATNLWDVLSYDACLLVCEFYGWTYPTDAPVGWNPFDQVPDAWTNPEKWTAGPWEKLCRLLLLAEFVTPCVPEAKIPKDLQKAAEGLGVDVAAVKKQAIAEFKASQKGAGA